MTDAKIIINKPNDCYITLVKTKKGWSKRFAKIQENEISFSKNSSKIYLIFFSNF